MTLFDSDPGAPPESETDAEREVTDAPLASSGPAPGAVRVRMTVAYDGSGYRGFARQRNVPTVAGALGQAIDTVVGHPVDLVCAGRTDAGVHAAGQVVHFDLRPDEARDAFSGPDPDWDTLRRACNRLLAPQVVVRSAAPAAPGFDARRSALWRRYRYWVLNRESPDPFLARTAWHVEEPLDLRAMQLACDPLYGEHDFSAFCRQRPDGTGSTVRRVLGAEWTAPLGMLLFEIKASAFCHQMVRSIVGTMVEVGRGRLRAGDLTDIIRSGQRSRAGGLAPPHGLSLEEVGYPES